MFKYLIIITKQGRQSQLDMPDSKRGNCRGHPSRDGYVSYVESNLIQGEEVVAWGKIHWYVYVPGLLITLAGLVLLFVSPAGGVTVLLVGLVLLLRGWIAANSTELAITNKRGIAKFGFIRRNTIELLHSKVEGFHVEQGILGRILNFGTVIVNGVGAGKTPVPSIAAPLEFRKQAQIGRAHV